MSDRRFRQREGRVLLEGVRLVESALEAGAIPEIVLFSIDLAATPRGAGLAEALGRAGPCFEVAPRLLDSVADTRSPQGVVAVVGAPELAWPAAPSLVLTLDGLQDPGNVGTLVRSAAAAGADGALLATGTADAFGPKAMRAGMGAQFRLPVRTGSWSQIAELARGLAVVVADAGGELTYDSVDWTQPTNLVIGGEAQGPGEMARDSADFTVRIPMARATESLNAAAAGAVVLFEVVRQRRQPAALQA